jgi:FemAB-related protein (PEP-CTERM system-associated)
VTIATAPSSDPEVRAAEPLGDAERDRFVSANADGSVFHLSGWRRAVERAFGHEPRDLVALRAGRIVGVQPLLRCRKLSGGADLISVPYGVYGGPIGESPEVVRALASEAIALGRRERVGRVELRCTADPGLPELAVSELYATFVRDLPTEVSEVMTRMPKRARAEVRKAIEKHGLTLEEGPRFLPELARLFGESKQRLGSPGLPLAWFEALAEELGEACVCHAAVRSGEVVAATMSFVFRDSICFYYIGTTAEANRTFNATNFLTTRLQEWGVERGLARFDLSRSRVGTGSYSFKEHQGFVPTPLAYRYAFVRSHALPALTPSNPRTKFLREAWTKLPSWLARGLSGRLARYLP